MQDSATFRQPEVAQWYSVFDKELRHSEKQLMRTWDLLMNCIYPVDLYCQERHKGFYDFFVLVQVKEGSLMKFGQVPMWTLFIENDLRKQLGASEKEQNAFERKVIGHVRSRTSYGLTLSLRTTRTPLRHSSLISKR
jgi:hypothetical protein